jgi:hypothetical protein
MKSRFRTTNIAEDIPVITLDIMQDKILKMTSTPGGKRRRTGRRKDRLNSRTPERVSKHPILVEGIELHYHVYMGLNHS